jgi:hypothetical protein
MHRSSRASESSPGRLPVIPTPAKVSSNSGAAHGLGEPVGPSESPHTLTATPIPTPQLCSPTPIVDHELHVPSLPPYSAPLCCSAHTSIGPTHPAVQQRYVEPLGGWGDTNAHGERQPAPVARHLPRIVCSIRIQATSELAVSRVRMSQRTAPWPFEGD